MNTWGYVGSMGRNYSYQRKKLLSLRDIVILHLEPFSSRGNPYDMPEATCQEAMSRLLSASRGNLSRVMNELKDEGFLDEMRAHVPIGKLRRKTYVLSEVGMKEARSLRRRTGNQKIRLRDENGDVFEVKLAVIPRELRDGSSLLDIALNVHRGMFDKQAYFERIQDKSAFVSIQEQMPRVKHFFGRERKLNEISDWFESKTKRILEVRGVAGIGKTALVATAFDDLKEKTNAIWLSINEQSTVRSVLEEVAALLKLLGKKKLDAYLKSHEKMEKEEILYIASTEFRGANILFVVDGCEKIHDGLADFIRFSMRNIEDDEWIRIIFVGRKLPRLYNKRALKKRGLLGEVVLKKLDFENSKKILQLKGVERIRYREAYAQTGGLPLFLELVEPTHEFKETDVERYLRDEVLSELSQNEMRLLKIVSTFQGPVHSDAFFKWKGVKHSTIRSMVEKSLLLEVSPMVYDTHDVLRDSIKKKLRAKTKRSYHKKAAKFYLGQSDVASMVQGSSHLIDAGEIGGAVDFLASKGRQIIAKGYSEDLYGLLLVLDSEKLYSEAPELAFLKGECLSIRGLWDDAIEEYSRNVMLSDKQGNLLGVSVSLRRIAGIHRKRGNDEDALKSLRKGVKISEKIGDFEGLADYYYNMAALMLMKGVSERFEEYVSKCLETAEISGNLSEISKAHKILGALYINSNKNRQALRAKRKAVEYAKDAGDLHLLNECYIDLGVAYYELGKNDDALRSYEKACESTRRIGDARATAYTLSNMASVYIEKPNLLKAEECLDEAMEIFHVIQEERMVARAHLSYGFLYDKRGKWAKATKHFKESLRLAEKLGNPADLFRFYKTVGQITLKRNRGKGMAYLEKASAIANRVKEVSLRNNLKSEIQSALAKASHGR